MPKSFAPDCRSEVPRSRTPVTRPGNQAVPDYLRVGSHSPALSGHLLPSVGRELQACCRYDACSPSRSRPAWLLMSLTSKPREGLATSSPPLDVPWTGLPGAAATYTALAKLSLGWFVTLYSYTAVESLNALLCCCLLTPPLPSDGRSHRSRPRLAHTAH
jgi:hypothetical protein